MNKLKTLILSIIISSVAASIVYAWTNPSDNPPLGGGVLSSAPSYPIIISSSTDSLFSLVRIGAANPVIFKVGIDSAFVINAGAFDVLTLKSGNVGIGTTDPGTNKLQVNGKIQAIGGDICTDQGGGKCLSATTAMRIVGGKTFGSGASENYDVSDANLVFLVLFGDTHAGVGNYWLEKKADGWYISGYAGGGAYSSYVKLGTSSSQFRLTWADGLYDMQMKIVDINTFYFWTYANKTSIVSVTKFK